MGDPSKPQNGSIGDGVLDSIAEMPEAEQEALLVLLKKKGVKGIMSSIDMADKLQNQTGRREGSVASGEVTGKHKDPCYGDKNECYDPAKDKNHPQYARLKAAREEQKSALAKRAEKLAKKNKEAVA